MAQKFLRLIRKVFTQVDIIIGNYKNFHSFVKRDERIKISLSVQVEIISLLSKILVDYKERMIHDCQKNARVIELLFECIETEKLLCFEELDYEAIVFSNDEVRVKWTCDKGKSLGKLETPYGNK